MIAFKAFVRQKAKGALTDGTLELYDRDRQRLQGRLGSRLLTVETAQELEDWLRSKTSKPNTLQRWFTSLNWWCRWKGVDYQARRPPKEANLHPVIVPDADYRQVLARVTEPMERIAMRLNHDTFWNPDDIVKLRVQHFDLSGTRTIVRKFRGKTHVLGQAAVDPETDAELRAYLEANPGMDYLFPGDRRKGCEHRNRTWLNAVYKRCGARFTPRNFRSTGANRWPGDDDKGLLTQGAWGSIDTVNTHYRAVNLERQAKSFDVAMASKKGVDEEPDEAHDRDPKRPRDLPGYG